MMDTPSNELPETPAPVFAFRAFKHAIFGTPKPGETERKPRRRDLDSKPGATSPEKDPKLPRRPGLAHSRSSRALLASPAKGILLTPGTANNRRKTVSFGSREQVQAQIAKEAKEKATPKEIPGRFPTPYTTKQPTTSIPDNKDDAGVLRVTSSASTRTLASDHDSLSQRFKRLSTDAQIGLKGTTKQIDAVAGNATPFDIWVDDAGLQDPAVKGDTARGAVPAQKIMEKQACGADDYWKNEYEAYATKSTREMKKLVKKEQVARKYAKEKARELLQCQETLTEERKRSKELQDKSTSFEAQLAAVTKENKRLQKELESLRKQATVTNVRTQGGSDTSVQHESRPSSSKGRQDQLKTAVDAMSSDIWADSILGGPSERESRPRRRPSRTSTTRKPQAATAIEENEESKIVAPIQDAVMSKAMPLGQDADVVNASKNERKDAASIPTKNESGMSEERREAARKRLEERKKSRVTKAM